MSYLEPRILSNIDETYFIRPPTSDSLPQSSWDDERKQQLYKIYQDHMSPKGQCGFSKSLNAVYLKMIKIVHYIKGGHVILPIYLLNHHLKGVYEEDNGQYQSIFDEHNTKKAAEIYQKLSQLSYNHIFPDGRVIEYTFNGITQVKETYLTNMFYATRSIREYTLLKEDLEEISIRKQEHKKVFKV
jgi:hypothetical protein